VKFWITQTLNGATFAALLFLLASGFTLIFGLLRVVNLAHGAYYLVGGYVGMTVALKTHNFLAAVVVGALAVTVMGLFFERVLLRPLRGQELPEVLLTMGLAFLLGDLTLAIWGGDPRRVEVPTFLQGSLHWGTIVYPYYRLFVLALGAVIATLLWLLQQRTRVGAMIRAGVDDRQMVSALGINIDLVFAGVFALGSCLAGVSGVVGGAFLSLYPGADMDILLFALVVVIIGGLGTLQGAVVGSLVVGLLDTFGKALFPELSYFTIFAPMAIILTIRPQGLFGRALP
jgi:branched-chain amino acid transport system permease protein